MSPAACLSDMVRAGISKATAEFVYEEFLPYYHHPLAPEPDDRVHSTMRIDPEDIEDIALQYCDKFSIPAPSVEYPAHLPEDPSLKELALWLEQYRYAQASG